jgi:hypothetical protein
MLFALTAALFFAGAATADDLKKEQFDLATPVRKSVNDIDNVIQQLETIKSQLKALEKQIPKDGTSVVGSPVITTPPAVVASPVVNTAPIVAGAVFQDSGVWKKKAEDVGNDWIWDGKNWFRYISSAPMQTVQYSTVQYPVVNSVFPITGSVGGGSCANGSCRIKR